MKGSTMLATLERLGVVASFSRPRVSDDNPFAEALFRTMKYRPEYPRSPSATLDDARAWVERFVAWYNDEHLHSGIRYVTPSDAPRRPRRRDPRAPPLRLPPRGGAHRAAGAAIPATGRPSVPCS